ncbi:hypothetical protein CR513_12812, partial [Mucuna pruriens]
MFPYVIMYKNGKENIMANALLTSLQTNLLGFEIIKDLYGEFLFKKNKLCVPVCSLYEMLVREIHGGFPRSQSGKECIFIVDKFSKMAHFIAYFETNDATHVTLFFKEVMLLYRLPRKINKLGIKLLFSTITHPHTNGSIKVVSRILATLLCAIIQKNLKIWGKCLTYFEFAYNIIVHSTTSYSLFEVILAQREIALT